MSEPKKKLGLDWRSHVEDQIREAQSAGEFDNLPGFGKPIPGIDEPHDENWWLREKLKREQISALPPALEIARDKEQTLARLAELGLEVEVRAELTALNERIRKAHYGCLWGPPCNTLPVEIDVAVHAWRASRRNS